MKKNINTISLAFILAITLIASKCNKDNIPPEDQLPPITQTGANTFGCLVNGKVYIPKGYSGLGGNGAQNPSKSLELGINGLPIFYMDAYKYNNSSVSEGLIIVSFRNLIGINSYNYPNNFDFSVGWRKQLGDCGIITFDTTIKKWGGGVITKYDMTNRIISGTFNFKYKTLTCDTVFITDGRFDFKL